METKKWIRSCRRHIIKKIDFIVYPRAAIASPAPCLKFFAVQNVKQSCCCLLCCDGGGGGGGMINERIRAAAAAATTNNNDGTKVQEKVIFASYFHLSLSQQQQRSCRRITMKLLWHLEKHYSSDWLREEGDSINDGFRSLPRGRERWIALKDQTKWLWWPRRRKFRFMDSKTSAYSKCLRGKQLSFLNALGKLSEKLKILDVFF